MRGNWFLKDTVSERSESQNQGSERSRKFPVGQLVLAMFESMLPCWFNQQFSDDEKIMNVFSFRVKPHHHFPFLLVFLWPMIFFQPKLLTKVVLPWLMLPWHVLPWQVLPWLVLPWLVFPWLVLGKPTCANCAFFLTLFKRGGSNPCSKILLQIFCYSKGLFGNIKLKDFLRAKMSQIEGKIV